MKQQHLQPQFDPTGIPTPPAWDAQPSLGAVSWGVLPGLHPTPSEALACWGYVPSLSIVLALGREICSRGRLTQHSREWANDPGVALAPAPHHPWQTRLLRPPEAPRGADVHPGVSERDRPRCLLPKIRLDAGSHRLVRRCLYFDHLRPRGGASLVVQWLRSYLATQGRWVRSLVGELRSHRLQSD